MPRTRSVLVDNTIGRIFRNVTAVSQATPANVIAGDKLVQRVINGGTSNLAVRNNIGGRGLFFISGGLVTQIRIGLKYASRGTPITVRVRRGTTYDTSSVIDTYSVPAGGIRAPATETFNVSISLSAGESLFFDITAVGTLFPGAGIQITVGFYTG